MPRAHVTALDDISKNFKHSKNKIGSISNLNIRGGLDLRDFSSQIPEFKMVQLRTREVK